MAEFFERFTVPQKPLLVLAAIFLALTVGTAIRLTLLRGAPAEKRRQRIGSLMAWWAMAVLFAAVVVLGPVAGIVLLGIASLQGMREFLTLTAERHAGRGLQWLAFSAVPLQYLWIYRGWYPLVWTFIPIGMFLLLPTRLILTGKMEGFIQAAAGVTWGLLLIVFCFSHAALLLTLPASTNPVAGTTGWFMYLVLLTETDDIAQALWGRRFGKHKVVPRVSPNKSWEGLILGIATTLVLAVVLAPVLTPLANGPTEGSASSGPTFWWLRPLLAGLLISLGGFFGDLTMSAVKRDLGVKDSGTLIPGQGGILDRIDSLTFAAPLFFYFVYFLYA